jgi:hypothetical protein
MFTKLKISCPFTIGTVLTVPCSSYTPLMQNDGFYSVQRPSQHCFMNYRYFFEEKIISISYRTVHRKALDLCVHSLVSHFIVTCLSQVLVPYPCPMSVSHVRAHVHFYACFQVHVACIDVDMERTGTRTCDTDTGQGHGRRT